MRGTEKIEVPKEMQTWARSRGAACPSLQVCAWLGKGGKEGRLSIGHGVLDLYQMLPAPSCRHRRNPLIALSGTLELKVFPTPPGQGAQSSARHSAHCLTAQESDPTQ